jgi:hypothetical protein
MAKAERSFPQGIGNFYVPAMQAAGDLGQALRGRIVLGAPVVASATAFLSAQSIAAAVDTLTFLSANSEAVMSRYGRCVQVVASGAATSNVTVYGRDYLGQKMRESFTLNGTTPVVGLKAFRYIDRVTAAITGGTTINLGHTDKLGLPYVTTRVLAEYMDNVLQSAGTHVAPVFTDPQTATTGDPRGTYDPNGTLNGTRIFELDCDFDDFVNAANNGGMHGIRHFNG